jgi:3-methylcrotonyl-CoA carboxylase alpha subunit
MFAKILIANRGEIACRVLRTARAMGIRTVAVFSDADAKALHVEMADEAVHIGPPPARDSYLRADKIIDAAKRTGAQAIHPGYGFLSENADFAEACAAAGIVFVGPSPAAIRAMGSKAEAKRLMEAAGVPLVPGYHGEDQTDAPLAAEAERIGFPVLIKASAGGGGRGMRAVERAEDFANQLAAARREAEAAFGDGRVLLEKYLHRPRHIEVQLLGDTHGTLLHLGTRDCSIQRRHQKIVEEAPAPGLSDATREKIHQAALAAGRAVNYTNAGTVEFIAEGPGPDPNFYFMEMNTRLQVEHPVTEDVYGIDLVEAQLRVAAGEALAFAQSDLVARGHAIEVRLCAEDPAQDFRPSTGRIRAMHRAVHAARIDDGYRPGDVISQHYDNLLAKIIVHAPTRTEAIVRLRTAVESTGVFGPVTNIALLRRIARHPALEATAPDTGFIARHQQALLPARRPVPTVAAIAAMLPVDGPTIGEPPFPKPSATFDESVSRHFLPWLRLRDFRLAGFARRRTEALAGSRRTAVNWQRRPDGLWVEMPDGTTRKVMHFPTIPLQAWQPFDDEVLQLEPDGIVFRRLVDGPFVQVTLDGDPEPYDLTLIDPYDPPDLGALGPDRITAPIPGTVVRVDVAEGETVTRGKVLAVLEAMKTEIRITAPADGTVTKVLVAPGTQVQEGTELVTLSHPEDAA